VEACLDHVCGRRQGLHRCEGSLKAECRVVLGDNQLLDIVVTCPECGHTRYAFLSFDDLMEV